MVLREQELRKTAEFAPEVTGEVWEGNPKPLSMTITLTASRWRKANEQGGQGNRDAHHSDPEKQRHTAGWKGSRADAVEQEHPGAPRCVSARNDTPSVTEPPYSKHRQMPLPGKRGLLWKNDAIACLVSRTHTQSQADEKVLISSSPRIMEAMKGLLQEKALLCLHSDQTKAKILEELNKKTSFHLYDFQISSYSTASEGLGGPVFSSLRSEHFSPWEPISASQGNRSQCERKG